MENILKLSPIIIAFLGGIFGKPFLLFISSLHRRKLKIITNTTEALTLFDKYGSKFQTDFILPDLKETYFYIQTGIKTNEKSIKKYIDFKNKLGKNYTWNDIKLTKPHLNLEKENIEIKLGKKERVLSKVVLIAALLVLFIACSLLTYLNPFKTQNLKDVLFIIFTVFILMIVVFQLINSVNSILVAEKMEKSIKNTLNNHILNTEA